MRNRAIWTSRWLLAASAAALLFVPTLAQAAGKARHGAPAEAKGALLPMEQFTLRNGLHVVFHIDRSDPVVAVVLAAHVGSAREVPGRTGLAHLFEHLFFLDSENLGRGGLDRLSARVGGSGAAGNTSHDVTLYHQEVPSDALEKMIWAEADKLGYFINTVTDAVLAKERQVVKNEKRQNVDNQPYGQTDGVLTGALYPPNHPYHWTVLGSMADLDAMTLEDVRSFYRRWYAPNNATLVVAGDFDRGKARAWIDKYFGEIPRGPPVPKPRPRPATLAATRSLVIEDRFARLPEITLAWPTVTAADPDSRPLQVLLDLLTSGKEAPLAKVLVDERHLAAKVDSYQYGSEIAGEAYISVRGFEDVDLDRVAEGLDAGFARFELDGINAEALARIKTPQETVFFSNLESVEDKAQLIARFDLYAGTPNFGEIDLARLRAVTARDVMRVYRKYIAGRPHIVTSVVPKGHPELAVAGATPARIVEEAIVQGAEAPYDPATGPRPVFARTPSRFDRTVEPQAGPRPQVRLPAIWTARLADGLAVSGIENRELPLVRFELSLDGGRLFDELDRPGAANLLARMLTRGTARRTPAELENALKSLGAEISVQAQDERVLVSGNALARSFVPTMDLLREMLLEPRWDPSELALAKAATVAEIQSNRADPETVARRVMNAVMYVPAHILSRDPLGTERTVGSITMEDLKALHARAVRPNLARFRVVGAVGRTNVMTALAGLGRAWSPLDTIVPSYPVPAPPSKPALYFYDIPGAKQSMLLFGAPSLRRADPDFYPATVMNYVLGGGSFASRLVQQLRETKGYTYDVSSRFRGGSTLGVFEIASPVRSNVTFESAALIRDIVTAYGATYSDADLAVTKAYLTNSRARAFETAASKIRMLANIGDYGLPADYVAREGVVIDEMSVPKVRSLAARYLRPDRMIYVIVGDRASQGERLKALGLGPALPANALLAEDVPGGPRTGPARK